MIMRSMQTQSIIALTMENRFLVRDYCLKFSLGFHLYCKFSYYGRYWYCKHSPCESSDAILHHITQLNSKQQSKQLLYPHSFVCKLLFLHLFFFFLVYTLEKIHRSSCFFLPGCQFAYIQTYVLLTQTITLQSLILADSHNVIILLLNVYQKHVVLFKRFKNKQYG